MVDIVVRGSGRVDWTGIAGNAIGDAAGNAINRVIDGSRSRMQPNDGPQISGELLALRGARSQLASSGASRIDGVLSPEEQDFLGAASPLSSEEQAQNDAMFNALVGFIEEENTKGGFTNDRLGFSADDVFGDSLKLNYLEHTDSGNLNYGNESDLKLQGAFEKQALDTISKHTVLSAPFGLSSEQQNFLLDIARENDEIVQELKEFDFRNGNLSDLPDLKFRSANVDIGYNSGIVRVNAGAGTEFALGALSSVGGQAKAIAFVTKFGGKLGTELQSEANLDFQVFLKISQSIINNTKLLPTDRNGAGDIAKAVFGNAMSNNGSKVAGRQLLGIFEGKGIAKMLTNTPSLLTGGASSTGVNTVAGFGDIIGGISSARKAGTEFTIREFVLNGLLGRE